jgi:hypothetical protein
VAVPPRPATFAFDKAPPGCEVLFITFWRDRLLLDGGRARLQLVHTNAASREGSIDSAWNWAHAKPNSNTIPHYQIDRSGRARKMLPSNRRGIANATSRDAPGYAVHGNVRNWSLAYETADTGYLADPGISAFTEAQVERVATILAYESITAGGGDSLGIPLSYPSTWHGAGSACHTEPFGHPYWTVEAGKICPGAKKKQQVRERILPRAREIAAAWLGQTPPPTPPEEDDEVTEADKLQIIAGVVENIKSLDFVGRVVNYPVPVPGGGTADLWSLIVDSRARTMSAQAELAALRMDIAQLAGVGADQVTLEAINAKVDKLIKVVVGP